MHGVKLEFLPQGDSKKARENAKGHLLERLVSEYLENKGYNNIRLNNKVSGTEWDVYGNAALSNSPVIVSCKCLSTSVSPDPLKALGFDVQNQSYDNPAITGVLIAIPRISSDTRTYWASVNQQLKARIIIIEESDLIKELCTQRGWCSPTSIKEIVKKIYSIEPGDIRLVYSHLGAFWIQFIKNKGISFPNAYLLLNPGGELEQNKKLLEEFEGLLKLNESDLMDFKLLNYSITEENKKLPIIKDNLPLAHLTTAGTGWFDYKYPAPSNYFAGREDEVRQFINFICDVKNNKTATRVCIITGTSGIGKSSYILKLKEEVNKYGGFLVPINCISARGKTFAVSVFLRLIKELRNNTAFQNMPFNIELDGIDSLPKVIIELSEKLRDENITPIIVFDQFETALLDGPLSEKLVELVLQIEEVGANFIFGFAWKTDLWWPDDHVPYTAREKLRSTALPIRIEQFGPTETNILLRALSKEINMPILPELRKEIQLFSRGYPWLLKKVCWHIIEQIKRGVKQEEILDRKLDLRTLFETDLIKLDEEERDILKKLAAFMPTDTVTLGEAFSDINIHEYLNKFVNMRLIIKQGQTYNIYHDIFKEFLRTNRVPIEESYLLKMSPNKALEIIEILAESFQALDAEILAQKSNMKVGSLYNYFRDLDALGVASIRKGKAIISDEVKQLQTREALLRDIRRRLLRNTCIKEILKTTKDTKEIQLSEIVYIIKKEFPAASLQEKTWENYALTMISWLRFVGEFEVNVVKDGERSKSTRLVGAITNAEYPNYVISGVIRLVELFRNKEKFKKHEICNLLQRDPKTVEKSLIDARLLGFDERMIDGSWRLTLLGKTFLNSNLNERKRIIAKQIQSIKYFTDFQKRMKEDPNKKHKEIVEEIMAEKGKKLTEFTVRTITMVTRNWLKYCDLIEAE